MIMALQTAHDCVTAKLVENHISERYCIERLLTAVGTVQFMLKLFFPGFALAAIGLLTGLAAATPAWGQQASGAPAATTTAEEQIQGLLTQFPNGGQGLANAIAALLVANPQAASAVLAAAASPAVTASQLIAIAGGYNSAQSTLTVSNPAGAVVLQAARLAAGMVVAAALAAAPGAGSFTGPAGSAGGSGTSGAVGTSISGV